jgi:hypothetical protein
LALSEALALQCDTILQILIHPDKHHPKNDGWVDWVDGWIDGLIDGWMGGLMNGWAD